MFRTSRFPRTFATSPRLKRHLGKRWFICTVTTCFESAVIAILTKCRVWCRVYVAVSRGAFDAQLFTNDRLPTTARLQTLSRPTRRSPLFGGTRFDRVCSTRTKFSPPFPDSDEEVHYAYEPSARGSQQTPSMLFDSGKRSQ